jgi:hypothetical protein
VPEYTREADPFLQLAIPFVKTEDRFVCFRLALGLFNSGGSDTGEPVAPGWLVRGVKRLKK